MYFVYSLENKLTNELYYGYTNNLERRLKEHNIKNEYKLICYEAYISETDARDRERKLKNYGQARTHLKNRLRNSLNL
ncbi:MAG: GIY-YIG nuclease family protein [Candidatus Omnitrophica bacterium]|nr:GIY-YIG nuclease family protein [Candidatus Omnitrophota bacterium]